MKYFVALVAILAIAYFVFWQKPEAVGPVEIIVTLNAQNNSGEYGTAILTEEDGKATIALELLGMPIAREPLGAPADTIQPAHIHEGTCAALGAPRYQLKFPINGASETRLDVSAARLMRELPLAVNVHKSVAEATVYVACGDILAPTE